MAAFAASFVLPPGKPRILVPNECCYAGWEPLHGFATRVHTHGMGRCARPRRRGPGRPPAAGRVACAHWQARLRCSAAARCRARAAT